MSKRLDRPHLIWERTLHGNPQPSIWHTVDFGVGGHKQANIIAMYELTEQEAGMPIAALERIYPCPRDEEDQPEKVKLGDAA
ncbi:MAG TPA: hypothetical protein VH684_16600 [Xanthobacteraceae bacterium]